MQSDLGTSRWDRVLASPLFDSAYVQRFRNPNNQLSPAQVARFCTNPKYLTADPSTRFDAKAYLQAYPDCAEFEQHPIVHYLDFGVQENRLVFPVPPPLYSVPNARLVVETHRMDFTGAPMELLRLFTALDLLPDDILITSPVDGPLVDAWHSQGMRSLLHGCSELRIRSLQALDEVTQPILGILDRCQPQAVLVNSLMSFPMACAADALGIPYHWLIHEPSAKELLDHMPVDLQRRIFDTMQRSRNVIFVSDASYQAFLPHLGAADTHHIIPKKLPPVAAGAQADRIQARAALGLDDADVMCLSVGTFSRRKAQHVLVDALAQLDRGAQRLLCYMVGATGTEYSTDVLEKAAQIAPGTCAVHILPQTTTQDHRAEVERLFVAADCVIVTSNAESTPLTVSEAFAAGCPVICADVPGVSDEVRADENGLLFAAGDAADLARCIVQMRDDPALRRGLRKGAAGSAHSQDDHSQMVQCYAALLGG